MTGLTQAAAKISTSALLMLSGLAHAKERETGWPGWSESSIPLGKKTNKLIRVRSGSRWLSSENRVR
eukprot:7944843-Pyramimonas_sp.AAC.1